MAAYGPPWPSRHRALHGKWPLTALRGLLGTVPSMANGDNDTAVLKVA